MRLIFNYSAVKDGFKVPVEFKKIVKEIEIIEGKKLGEICFIFVSRETILNINRCFLKHDYVTDVITFNYSVKQIISGDIYICIDMVFENAEELGELRIVEMCRVMLHGLLHLIGYNDKDRIMMQKMREREDYYLSIIRRKGYWNDGSGV